MSAIVCHNSMTTTHGINCAGRWKEISGLVVQYAGTFSSLDFT